MGRNNLPWQNTQDPYRVWLSEIMLQQTQVATVRTYFAKFIAAMPTVHDLAAASQDAVMALWSGLGYYSRARNLHACAKAIVDSHQGQFPQQADVLVTLPGIGRSTAAAISALCFGERVAILDANVRRVLCRVLAFDSDLGQARALRDLWAAAETLLPNQSALMPRYTQGMMDLGATVCTTKTPQCTSCPVQNDCGAYRLAKPEAFPVRSRKVKRSSQAIWLLWLEDKNNSIFLSKRPSPGVWAGLHCLPVFVSEAQLMEMIHHTVPHATLKRPAVMEVIPPFVHVLTHKDLHLHVVRLCGFTLSTKSVATLAKSSPGEWFAPLHLEHVGLPAPIRKLLVNHAGVKEPLVRGAESK